MEYFNDRTVVANADLKADMERWHKHKQRDLKEIFITLADMHIAYYEKVGQIGIFSLFPVFYNYSRCTKKNAASIFSLSTNTPGVD